jgi:hypothetical protein
MVNPGGIPNWAIMVYIAADDVLSDFAVGSLQQLKRLAGEDTDVVVAAQFDANGKQDIPRFIFQGKEDPEKSIHDSKTTEIAPLDMANPEALRKFINWAYEQCKAAHYCLVLWGHGPELLTSDHPDLADGRKAKKFLTPSDVSTALQNTTLIKDDCKLDIVAIDACNMNMLEIASELQGYADFLVASQEEVPDFSFPYDRLLALGPVKDRDEIAAVCREIPRRYINAYRDYTLTQATQTKSITLSSLSLKNSGTVTKLLGQLVRLFMDADKTMRQAIIDARANSNDFVLGLYVDLFDFCERLNDELLGKGIAPGARSICDQLCEAIQARGGNSFIIANEVSQNQRCHGASIYFPYLTTGSAKSSMNMEENSRSVETRNGSEVVKRYYPEGPKSRSSADMPNQRETVPLARGGPDLLSKGGPDLLSKGGPDLLSKMRRLRIEETEQYYSQLKFAGETGWDKFIRHRWSLWLVKEIEAKLKSAPEADMSEALNRRYSAQQCALNLLSLCRELDTRGTLGDDAEAGNSNQQKRVPVDVLTR